MINFNVTGSLFSNIAEFQEFFENPQTKTTDNTLVRILPEYMDLWTALFYVLSTLRSYDIIFNKVLCDKCLDLVISTRNCEKNRDLNVDRKKITVQRRKHRFIKLLLDINTLNTDMRKAILEVFKSKRFFPSDIFDEFSSEDHRYSCIAEELVISKIIARILDEENLDTLDKMLHKFFYGPKGFSIMNEEVCLASDFSIPLESLICEHFGDKNGKVKNQKWKKILTCAKRSEKIVTYIQKHYK